MSDKQPTARHPSPDPSATDRSPSPTGRLTGEDLLDVRAWKLLRHLTGRNQANVAQLLGVSPPTLSKLEDEDNPKYVFDERHWRLFLEAVDKPDHLRKDLRAIIEYYSSLSRDGKDEGAEAVDEEKAALIRLGRLVKRLEAALDGLADGLTDEHDPWWKQAHKRSH